MRTEDWLVIASVACLLVLIVLSSFAGAGALDRRRRLERVKRRREEQARWAQITASGPEDWAWPRFPETVARQIQEELQR